MTIGEKISARRKELKLTLEDVGNAVGVGKSTVKKWETGYIANMRRDKISLLAKVLQMNPSEFVDGNDDTRESSNISAVLGNGDIYNIPVFESVSAGFGAYASDDILEYIPVIITNYSDVADTIAIKVKGDSMYPKIEDGDTIVVRRQTSVDSGDIAVVLLDGDEGLVKRVVYGPTWIELRSINEKYPVQRFDGAEVTRLRVVGKVTGSYKKF